MPEPRYSMRLWLYYRVMLNGVHWTQAVEAVYSTALEHPEWDLDEQRTWNEWEEAGHI